MSSLVQSYFTPKEQGGSPPPKDYNFSDDQVKRAMEEVIRQKIEQPSSINDTATDQSEARFQFEIELHTGAIIYTDNAEIGDETVSYSSKNGLTISLNRDEIKTLKRVPKK